MMPEQHPLVCLARDAIDAYVRQGRVLAPPTNPCEEMRQRHGVFVSLHRGSELRGCIGTIEPVRENVALEVISNAISAATQDPRFPPMAPHELNGLDVSVDVLTEPESVPSINALDPRKYGVIVESGDQRGLLLPDLPGIDTAEQQLTIALQKAWIRPNSPYRIFRFQVLRYR
jgi:AmmeMemoRadiSam system protein A